MRLLYPLAVLLLGVMVVGCRNTPPPQLPPPPPGSIRVVAPGVNVNVVDPNPGRLPP